MGNYNYSKISRISFSASSSGMMMGSNKSLSEEVLWKNGGSIVLVRTEISGFTKEESTWNLSSEQAEEIRAMAERIDMASWGELEYKEDPRFQCTDYSSRAGGSIFLDYRELGGKPFEMVHFDRRAVLAAEKGEDLKKIEELFAKFEDPDKRVGFEKTETQSSPMGAFPGMMGMPANGFMGMAMPTQPGGDTASANVPDDTDASMWTCACGNRNEGKFCSNCGRKRP